MTDTLKMGVQELYKQLLRLADKEEQAIIAENLQELEACAFKKHEILKRVSEAESRCDGRATPEERKVMAALLTEVAEKHERTQKGIQTMCDECRKGVLRIRNGRHAHRAYHRAGQQEPDGSGRLM